MQRLIELHRQRGRLQERAAMQRNQLSRDMEPLAQAFDLSARLQALAREATAFVRGHPLAFAAALGALVVWRPTAMLRWGQRALLLWRGWRAARDVVPGLLTRFLGSLR